MENMASRMLEAMPKPPFFISNFLSKSDFLKYAQKWPFLNVARATFL